MSGETRTFLITGVSSGLGRAFARGALAAGHRVIGSVRKAEDGEAFAALAPDRAHPLLLDVTDYAAIPGAVAQAEAAVGPIDVLVNNAGYPPTSTPRHLASQADQSRSGWAKASSKGGTRRMLAANWVASGFDMPPPSVTAKLLLIRVR